MNLKKFLKALKLNESSISMVLGALVIIIVGVLLVNYFKDRGFLLKENGLTSETSTNIHTVTKGESLWAIAESRYGSGYNWVDIAKENNLTDPGQIEVGQELTLPDTEPKTLTAAKTAAETISSDTYTVVKGDHLWGIAVRAYGDGYRWVELFEANSDIIADPDIIEVGMVLNLPR